jgi:hypothetical protein
MKKSKDQETIERLAKVLKPVQDSITRQKLVQLHLKIDGLQQRILDLEEDNRKIKYRLGSSL